MKHLLRRALSKEFRQIDDFQLLCQSLKHHGRQYPQQLNNIISKMSIKRSQIIGDDLLLRNVRSLKRSKPTDCSIATLIDSASRNNLYFGDSDDLKSITINKLQSDHIHYGHKLDAEIIDIPSSNRRHNVLSQCIVIEDMNGETVPLYIYNLNPFRSKNELNLKIGDSVTVQQPYSKQMVDGTSALRTDNPLFNLCTKHNAEHHPDSHSLSTFVHPDIAMEFIDETKGRGIISTMDIAEDTLILKEPPLCWAAPSYPDVVRLFAVDMERDKVYWHSDALHDLRAGMQRIIRFGTEYDRYLLSILHRGINHKESESVIVDMDMLRYRMTTVPVEQIVPLTVNDIVSIINCNAFRVCNDDQVSNLGAAPSALIVAASLFNHGEGGECNIRRHFVWTEEEKSCEMWTKRHIRKGEELTQDYGYDPVRDHKNW